MVTIRATIDNPRPQPPASASAPRAKRVSLTGGPGSTTWPLRRCPPLVHLPGPERLSRWELGRRLCAEQRLDPLRREAAGRGEILDRLQVLVLSLVDQATLVERLRAVGIERERLVEQQAVARTSSDRDVVVLAELRPADAARLGQRVVAPAGGDEAFLDERLELELALLCADEVEPEISLAAGHRGQHLAVAAVRLLQRQAQPLQFPAGSRLTVAFPEA